MQLDPRTKTYAEMVEAYVIRYGRTDTPEKMACDLVAYESELGAAEREIDRLKRQISAGYIRRDISSHYEADWKPKPPLADVIADDWIATGREAA